MKLNHLLIENNRSNAKKRVDISVLIATIDRPHLVHQCILSILKNHFVSYEIILVDQSNSSLTSEIVSSVKSRRIRYFHSAKKGKAEALNLGLERISGSVVAFTDDDCRVKSNWLHNIHQFLADHGEVGGVFGPTLPYQEKRHSQEICPATFGRQKEITISDPYIIHYRNLGLGNNMAIRTNVIRKIGTFESWLGPGKFGLAGGEDSEYIYRILKQNYRLAYSPGIVVYHNRWLTYHEEQLLQSRYTRSALAFSFYHILHGDIKIGIYIVDRLNGRVFSKLREWIHSLKRLPMGSLHHQVRELNYLGLEILNIIAGIAIALTIYIKTRILISIEKINRKLHIYRR